MTDEQRQNLKAGWVIKNLNHKHTYVVTGRRGLDVEVYLVHWERGAPLSLQNMLASKQPIVFRWLLEYDEAFPEVNIRVA